MLPVISTSMHKSTTSTVPTTLSLFQQPAQYVFQPVVQHHVPRLETDKITSLLLYAQQYVNSWNQMHYPQFHLKAHEVFLILLQNAYSHSVDRESHNVTEQSMYSSVYNPYKNLQTITEDEQLNPDPPAFYSSTPSLSPTPPSPSPSESVSSAALSCKKMIKSKEKLIAKYPHRAQLNVFIPKDITSSLLHVIMEQFPNAESLYYYMDISTGLQLNDDQMYRFNIDDEEVVFVNYDLHRKHTEDPLYGVIHLNQEHGGKKGKWRWKLVALKTANEIHNEYGVCYTDLPLSSRRMDYFQKQIEEQSVFVNNMDVSVIDTTDWIDIKQIRSLRRKYRPYYEGQLLQGDINTWIELCKSVWNKCKSIPIVVNGSKQKDHWIEWIKLIPVGNNECIGVSCQYVKDYDEWFITSICLDKGDVENKHRLIGFKQENMCMSSFDNFTTTFTEIQWIKSNYRNDSFH